jgi:hypothetical protein
MKYAVNFTMLTAPIKTGPIEFAVLDRTLVDEVFDEGAQVHVEPYARRRFDGQRADTPQEITETASDGTLYTVKRVVLGEASVKLPIPAPQCPELGTLIEQLEQLPAPDGFRRIAHLLVDAGACDFTWVDPLPGDIIATPPAISFAVATARFQGRVTVLYRRGLDLYEVQLHRDGELLEQVDNVFVDDLGQMLETLIDDGSWRRIRVQPLSGCKVEARRDILAAGDAIFGWGDHCTYRKEIAVTASHDPDSSLELNAGSQVARVSSWGLDGMWPASSSPSTAASRRRPIGASSRRHRVCGVSLGRIQHQSWAAIGPVSAPSSIQ